MGNEYNIGETYTVYGKVIDDNYSRVLFDNPDFDIETIFLIDRIQKHKEISKDAVKQLRKLCIKNNLPNNLPNPMYQDNGVHGDILLNLLKSSGAFQNELLTELTEHGCLNDFGRTVI